MSLCIFDFVMTLSFLPCEAGVFMPDQVSYGYLTGICMDFMENCAEDLSVSAYVPCGHGDFFLCGFLS